VDIRKHMEEIQQLAERINTSDWREQCDMKEAQLIMRGGVPLNNLAKAMIMSVSDGMMQSEGTRWYATEAGRGAREMVWYTIQVVDMVYPGVVEKMTSDTFCAVSGDFESKEVEDDMKIVKEYPILDEVCNLAELEVYTRFLQEMRNADADLESKICEKSNQDNEKHEKILHMVGRQWRICAYKIWQMAIYHCKTGE